MKKKKKQVRRKKTAAEKLAAFATKAGFVVVSRWSFLDAAAKASEGGRLSLDKMMSNLGLYGSDLIKPVPGTYEPPKKEPSKRKRKKK